MPEIRPMKTPDLKIMTRLVMLTAATSALGGCVPLAVSGAVVGTTAVIAQERTVGDAVDDIAIRTKLEAQFLGRSMAMYQNVDTDVIEGRVLLTGSVPTPEHRIEASRIAWSTPNVREVLNEIEVTKKSNWDSYPKDAWISTKLSMRLLGDRRIRDINYNVETLRGTVYLIGIARDLKEHDRVVRHARSVAGVRRIVDHIQLKDDPARTRAELPLRRKAATAPLFAATSTRDTSETAWDQ